MTSGLRSKTFKEYLDEVPLTIYFPLWKPKPQWGVDVSADITFYDKLREEGIFHPDDTNDKEK